MIALTEALSRHSMVANYDLSPLRHLGLQHSNRHANNLCPGLGCLITFLRAGPSGEYGPNIVSHHNSRHGYKLHAGQGDADR